MRKLLFLLAFSLFVLSFNACNSDSNDEKSTAIEQEQKTDADSSLNSSLNDLNADLTNTDSTEKATN